MEAAKADLGAAQAPESVDARTEARIERAIEESFVAGFRAVMLASAGLALASALVAALLVGDTRVPSTDWKSCSPGGPQLACTTDCVPAGLGSSASCLQMASCGG